MFMSLNRLRSSTKRTHMDLNMVAVTQCKQFVVMRLWYVDCT